MSSNESSLPPVFFRFQQQVLHFAAIPAFVFLFLILYKPLNLVEYLTMPAGGYAFNSSMIAAILFVLLLITRILLWGLRNVAGFKRRTYFFWCAGEVMAASFFIAMYVTLMSHGEYEYIDVLPIVLADLIAILVYPYVLITLFLESDLVTKYVETGEEESKIRFYDEKHNLKFVTQAGGILVVQSDENYCNIFYSEGNSVKKFQLRATMRSLEEMCAHHGIIRCHRSYFVNVKRIKALRREKEGVYSIQMDSGEITEIPVSRRYYDDIASRI